MFNYNLITVNTWVCMLPVMGGSATHPNVRMEIRTKLKVKSWADVQNTVNPIHV